MQHLPEWPAAPLLIRRLVAQLNTERGLRHQSGGGGGSGSAEVRLVNIDLLRGGRSRVYNLTPNPYFSCPKP